MTQLVLTLLLAASLLLTPAAADDAVEPPKPPAPVRRFYDVTDLVHAPAFDDDVSSIVPVTRLTPAHRYPSGGSGGGGGGLMSSPPGPDKPETTPQRLERLTKLIQATVAPEAWTDTGGSSAQLLAYGSRLIVTAPPATHVELARLLAEIRQHEVRCVRLRVTWAALSDDELASALVPPAKTDPPAAPRIVDLAAVDKLKTAVRHRAEINALNGRRTTASAGRVRNIMTNVDAAVGNNSAAYEPNIELLLAGASIDAVPMLSEDGSALTIEVRSAVGRWDPADAPPIRVVSPAGSGTTRPTAAVPGDGGGGATEIDRINMPIHALTAATKIPTGRPVLIGGMTGAADKDDPRTLYLILEAWGDPLAPPAK